MTEEEINTIAEFFTGTVVATTSMALSLPDKGINGVMRRSAQQYFAVRKIFGIEGYEDLDDAIVKIKEKVK